MEREVAKQAGNNHPTGFPTGIFKTSDGVINITTIAERFENATPRVRPLQAIANDIDDPADDAAVANPRHTMYQWEMR